LSGTTPVLAFSGLATFSDLAIDKIGNGYTLAASSPGLLGVVSLVFNITPGSCISQASASWNVASTWLCNRVPLATDDVTISATIAVFIPTGVSAVARSVTVAAGAASQSLQLQGTASLTVGGDVVLNQPTSGNNTLLDVATGTMSVAGSLSFNGIATN